MKKLIANLKTMIFKLIGLFSGKGKNTESDIKTHVTKELDFLWEKARSVVSEQEKVDFRRVIADSFTNLRKLYTDEELDNVYAWSRYVQVAISTIHDPIRELVEYVSCKNYIPLTKQATNAIRSAVKKNDSQMISNAEAFVEAVYSRIVTEINPHDQPALLGLGKLAQKRREYDKAKEWFLRITEEEDPIHGVTALLACYEAESKELLSLRQGGDSDKRIGEQLGFLNSQRFLIYSQWCNAMKQVIDSRNASELFVRQYVDLLTGFARFERSRNHFDASYRLLLQIPESYPDIHRVYTERAMLYQFKPALNQYYSLSRSIAEFHKALEALKSSSSSSLSDKGIKSVLMPLANAYFRSSQYEEAVKICEQVLQIDKKEYRAIRLLDQISALAG